jgi:hypothetical protein
MTRGCMRAPGSGPGARSAAGGSTAAPPAVSPSGESGCSAPACCCSCWCFRRSLSRTSACSCASRAGPPALAPTAVPACLVRSAGATVAPVMAEVRPGLQRGRFVTSHGHAPVAAPRALARSSAWSPALCVSGCCACVLGAIVRFAAPWRLPALTRQEAAPFQRSWRSCSAPRFQHAHA